MRLHLLTLQANLKLAMLGTSAAAMGGLAKGEDQRRAEP